MTTPSEETMTTTTTEFGKLHPDVKDAWVQALRSGQYKQGIGYLRQEEDGGQQTYCCLGVLCEIAVQQNVIDVEPYKYQASVYAYDDSATTMPPRAVRRWAWAVEPPHELWAVPGSRDAAVALTMLNDDERLTFDQIADVIERTY